MKPNDQIKVIVLTFLSIVLIAGVMYGVSVATTNYVKSHHASDTEHVETPVAQSHSSSTTASETAPPAAATPVEAEKVAEPEAPVTPVVTGDVEAGAKVFMAKTCATCHKIDGLEGAVGVIGPALNGLGKVAATRVAGEDAITYIKASIENPNAHVVENYPPAMPPLRASMSDEEFNNLVAYLASL